MKYEQEQVREKNLTVVQLGLGKAGTSLHAGIWNALPDVDVFRVGYDTNPERRAAAAENAGMVVVGEIAEIPDALAGRGIDIVDNTTSSGSHAASTRAMLDIINVNGLAEPKAWLLEKPVVSGADEKVVLGAALDEIGRDNVFVNENYLASVAVTRGREIIASKVNSGVALTDLTVHFTKDRVPNVVLDGRFTDTKGLAVFGIEMPHQLAIASALLGEELDTREGGSITRNDFLHDIDGISASEGNITEFDQNGTHVTLRQGLGPFEFMDDNSLVRREFDWRVNEANRYASARFADGSVLRLTFDPVPGLPRYHSLVEFSDPSNPQLSFSSDESFADNTLQNLIGAVATFALSNRVERAPLLNQVTPDSAIRYAEQLSELRASAGDPKPVGLIVPGDASFADDYNTTMYAEKAARAV